MSCIVYAGYPPVGHQALSKSGANEMTGTSAFSVATSYNMPQKYTSNQNQ